MLHANVGDLRRTDDGAAVIHVRGKGDKDRGIPIESAPVAVLEHYLDSRIMRFPATARQRSVAGIILFFALVFCWSCHRG
jgi:integrase/recombinase XerC